MKNTLNKQKIELIGALLLIVIFIAPFLTFASSRNSIYVDGSKVAMENGTQSNPYHTISEAILHADKKTDIHVAKGVYEDNIEIPKGVKIFGSSAEDVIVRAKNTDKVVISMSDETKINKITVENGKEGVWVKKNAYVSIVKCVIKNNDKDGISIGSGSTDKDSTVNITDSTIKNNGRAGIYSQKRRLSLINNDVINNKSDGVVVAAGSKAWMEDNNFKDNDGSGVKLTLDGSDIWTKSNTYRGNDHSGMEINAYGKTGRIDVNKSKFVENSNYGVARIARNVFATSVWNGLTVQSKNTFQSSKQGNISSIIRVK